MMNMVLRAPILTLALASLFLNGRVVLAQFDTGHLVRTALDTTTAAKAQVIFYHENVAGSYDVDFYYTGCDDRMPLNAATIGITTVTQTAVSDAPVDAAADIGFINQCGVDDNAACTRKTTYSFVVEALNGITDNRIKSTANVAAGIATYVKFCIRHRMLNSNNVEMAYREAEVTVTWDTNGNFIGTVATANDTPDVPTLDVGDVRVKVERCSNIAASPPDDYEQGELIQLCLFAEHTGVADATPAAEVTIVKVNSLRFWIDIGDNNNVYEFGETTQLGMENGLPVGTTAIIPAGAGVGATVCSRVFTNAVPASAPFVPTTANALNNKKGCVLSTLLTPAFFAVGGDATTVDYAGSVTIEFGNGTRRRRVLSLRGDRRHHRSAQQVKVGDQFDKSYASTVTTTSANNDDNNSSTCSCSGFFLFKIFCWIFRCLLGFN